MRDPAQIEKTLKQGAEKARAIATPFTARLRHAVGLRPLDSLAAPKAAKTAKAAAPSFKQYRESDGMFYFRLLDAKGQLLLQSTGFSHPKEAAQAIARLQQQGLAGVAALAGQLDTLADEDVLAAALSHFTETAGT
jgi:tryptophanyl-tRNA synthetase